MTTRTIHVSNLFSIDLLNRMIDEGFVNRQKHPELDLWIYNYSHTCQFSRVWNDVTLQCRGLILDADMNIVSRPFSKFFNLEEHPRSDVRFSKKDFQVFEKLDGSLGILYPTGTRYAIATRGSFTSDQALRASMLLQERYVDFVPEPGYTYLFEIIYPDNRIVVDYGGVEGLVFLCAVDNVTGANVFEFGGSGDWPGLKAARYDVTCQTCILSITLRVT